MEEFTPFSAYEVSCQDLSSSISHHTGVMTPASHQSIIITGVLLNTTYQCCVQVVVTKLKSIPTCVNTTTYRQGEHCSGT